MKLKIILHGINRRLDKKLKNNYIAKDMCLDDARPRNCQLNVFGYFNYVFSISSNARDFCDLLSIKGEMARIPLRFVTKKLLPKIECSAREHLRQPCNVANINLWFVNFDYIQDCLLKNKRWVNDRYNLAVFWWEFDRYFTFNDAFKSVNEVVVFSTVTYAAVIKAKPERVKLTRLSYPFIHRMPRSSIVETRKKFALSQNEFIVMYTFDVHSALERKNPQAVIQAFAAAARKVPEMCLVLKISNFEMWRAECVELLQLITELNLEAKCKIIEDDLSDIDMRDLVNCCDAYLSLHRAEGLGLGMLEAMSLGKPVIATRFGGNLDFMDSENSCLVDYELCRVQKNFGAYKKGYEWAEPKVQQATEYLVRLAIDAEYRQQISEKASLSIARQYKPEKLQQEYNDYFNSLNKIYEE